MTKPLPHRRNIVITRQADYVAEGAEVVGDLQAGEFIHTLGDAHLYSNHFEQARLQLSRTPKTLPTMNINPEVKDLFGFKFEDFELLGYDPDPHIKAAVVV